MPLNFKFIGWKQDGTTDKVWGVIYLGPLPTREFLTNNFTYVKTVTFWGRRGSKLQTKIGLDDSKMFKTIADKKNSGI